MMFVAAAKYLPHETILAGTPAQRRNLLGACVAHALHDGYTDQLYALLPVWQAQFGLSYAGLATVRALYYGTMSGLQIPGDRMISRLSARTALAFSTLIAAAGFLMMALPIGFAGLCLGLVLAGIGSSVQHPRASLLVTTTYGDASRGPLGIYNFAGDLGKATLPAIVAVLLPVMAWQPVVGLMGVLGVAVAFALLKLLPIQAAAGQPQVRKGPAKGKSRFSFALLMVIGGFDTAARMGFLLFLPFLIHARGGASTTVGLGLALVFIGGALGKATSNLLGQRWGIIGSVIATEMATALLIVATLFLPLWPMLALLPVLGIFLNGTSSLLYGTVPELTPVGSDTGRAFAFFYTSITASSALAPILFGQIADLSSQTAGTLAAAITAALIVPLALALRPALSE